MPFPIRKLGHALRLVPSSPKSLNCLNLAYSTNFENKEKRQNYLIVGQTPPKQLMITKDDLDLDKSMPPILVFPSTFMESPTSQEINELNHGIKKMDKLLAFESKDVLFNFNTVKYVDFTTDDIIVNPFRNCEFCDFDFHTSSVSKVGFLNDTLPMSSEEKPCNNNTYISQNIFESDIASPLRSDGFFFFSATGGEQSQGNGPSPEKLGEAKEKVEKLVLSMLAGISDSSVLHKDIILENNLFGRNKVSQGHTAYYLEMLKLRIQVHASYSGAKMEILAVSTLDTTGVIRVHWRMTGVSQVHVVKFWRFIQGKEPVSKDDKQYIEAFSYFHINKDGQVYKHRIDRSLPDGGTEQNPIQEKLQSILNKAKPLVS